MSLARTEPISVVTPAVTASSVDGVDVVDSLALKRVAAALTITGLVAVTIGIFFGPLQALNYANVNLYPALQPAIKSYYQGLTIHGVFNALVFTTFFISGFLYYVSSRELGVAPNHALSWSGFGVMFIGLLLIAVSIFNNSSSVLFTFYAPLIGSWAFYLGLALIVVGSWVFAWQILRMVNAWRRTHPGEITPLIAWMSLITEGMWFLASLGVVIAIVFFHLPLSLGLIPGIDPLVTRTLFWWTGHPLVYFWLMPAYISWYGLMPRQAGGQLVSDPLARIVFILLLVLSAPVGIHHQLQDAGIAPVVKGIIIFLTFLVILPSLMTAFTVGASLEHAGRINAARLGLSRGRLSWLRALPWRNPSFAAQAVAMLIFIIGGASGLVNASWILNVTVHNTTYVPGHFHATVATATALTFFGISFWLLPHLTGKPLFAPKAALAGSYLWGVGMLLFSLGMMAAGLFGVPRRDWASGMLPGLYEQFYGLAKVPLVIEAIGGVLLGVAAVLIFTSIYGTLLRRKPSAPVNEDIPFADALRGKTARPLVRMLDRTGFWFVLTAALMLIVYIPIMITLLSQAVPLSGLRRW